MMFPIYNILLALIQKIIMHSSAKLTQHSTTNSFIFFIFLHALLALPSWAISPSFVTSLTQCKTGSAVLAVSPLTTLSGYDTTSTTFSYPTSFSQSPNIALGLSYLSSTYSTTTALYSWLFDLSITSTSASNAVVQLNRTSGIISQISINYLAVLPTFFLEVSTTKLDLYATNLYTLTSSSSRNVVRSITYRTKSNSTNAVIAINTIGMHTLRQTVSTFSYTSTISAHYSTYFEVTINVAGYSRLGFISIVAVSYQSIATTINPPLYLNIGYISDFSGTIIQTSGATGVTVMGTIFTGMTEWIIDSSNGVNTYNLSFSANSYTLTSSSLTSCRNSYVWYRQQTCPQYYYLVSHNCVACDITCSTCSGTASTDCLTCTSTRSYNTPNRTCPCLSGYVDQGARQCTLITCNSDLCRTCAYIDQCATCYTGFGRELSGTQCVCSKYRYDHYLLDGSPFCDFCHYSCYTCTSASSSACLSCNLARDNRNFISSNSTCGCITGYYDENTAICKKCQYSCASCILSTYCTSCNSTKGRTYDNTSTYCMCSSGLYDDRLQQQCQTCMITCLTCADGVSCSTCPNTRQLTNTSTANNQCTCVNGYYDNGVSKLCLSCQYTCYTCINPTGCQSCSTIMHRQFNNVTQLCTCTSGYYDDGLNQLCANCYLMCAACSGAGSTSCTSCDAASYRTLSLSGQCICKDGYYQYDNNTVVCATCYYTCQKCVNGFQCTSCNNLKFRRVDATDATKCICMDGYYDTGNQLCTACPYYCLTCSNSSSCLTCDPTTRDINLNCVCKDGYYDDGVSNACQPCLSSCVTCSNAYSCTSCTPVIKYLTSTSQCKCSAGYLEPSCSICSYQCQQCTTTADNCVSCNGLNFRYYQLNNVTNKGDCLCYDGYYSDNVNSLCLGCHYSCKTCTSSTACLSCPTNRQFDVNNQYCECVSQYYQNSQSLNCLPCHYSCSNCSDYSVCTLCSSANKRVYNAVTKICNCQPGYYDDGSAQLCRSCAPQCKTCSAYIVCLSCDLPTNFRIINNATNRCPCTQGYYESTVDSLCHICHYSCLTCIDGSSCVACVAGRVFATGTGTCRCSDGTYENTTTLTCLACTYPCQTCSQSSSTCLSCEQTHTLIASSSSCYCQIGTYENTTQCASCLPTCYQCSNNLSCVSCRSSDNRNLVLISTDNQCTCINGFHDDNGANVVCSRCHHSCTSCLNAISCTSCADIRIMFNGTNGLCSCPLQRFYDDGANAACLPCSYLCLSCDMLSSNCTSCSASSFRYLVVTDAATYSNTCLCLNKYYSAGVGIQTCLSCHYSCRTCSNSTTCQTCNSTLFRLLFPSSTTYCACQNGYFDVTNLQQCQACSYACLTCSQSSSYCLTCPSTRNFTSNTCPCNTGLFDDMISNNATCFSCLYLCQTCSSASSCLTCPATRSMNSSNLCNCLSGYYDTLISKECVQCHPLCKQCSDYTTCTLCQQVSHLRVLYQSSCICQPGYFDVTISSPGSTNYVCQLCDRSCQRCQNSLTCSSCDSTMFRTRDINTGLCKCADGYYDDGTNQLCLSCTFDCLTCADATSCLTCSSGRVLDTLNIPNRCICSSSTFQNGTACQACPPECAQCTSASACTVCNNPTQRTLLGGSCPCNIKLFPVSNSATCSACHYSCASCTSYPFCASCSSVNHRYMSARQCKCLTSYYDDLASQLCQPCHYSCLTCTNSSECLTCDTSSSVNRVFNTSSKQCSCNSGYFEDPSLKICMNCNYSCYTCTNSNTCSSCSPLTLRQLVSSQCQCPSIGYFDQLLTSVCIPCDPTCYTCASSSSTCTGCNSLVTFRNLTTLSTCVCMDGYFQSSGTVICSTCSYKCLTCSSLQVQCTSCSSSNNRDNSTLPTCSCLQGFYDDGSSPACQLCDYRCLTCTDGFKCLTCDTTNNHRYLDLVSQMCKCSNRYYELSTSSITRDPVCLACHYSCLTCNHATLCLTCDLTGNTRYFNNGQCLCSTGYYDDNSSITCLPCSYTCQTCSNNLGCVSCNAQQNRFLNVTSVQCQCLRGYFDVGDGINPVCGECEQSCYTCTNSTHCQTCAPLTNKYVNSSQGTNYCICYYGYYEIVSTGICQICHYSCQRCSGSSTSCTVCDSTAHRTLSSGSCPCNPSYFDDGRNQLCLTCTTNCIRCFGSNSGQCLQCINGTYLLNGICWNVCPDFYYPIDSTWTCASCSSYCRQCSNNTKCLTCQSGFYLIPASLSSPSTANVVCTSPCPQFYYHNTTNCLKCISPCLRCTGLYTCIDCIETYYLDNSSSFCYPCHSTCRFCTNSAAIGCISCIDGYFLNVTMNLCVKMTCTSTQYVNSLYGCYQCTDTYPNSLACNSNEVTKCMDGYMIQTNALTGRKECIRCDRIAGYTLVYSTGLCEQICGDSIRHNDPCDDGNNLNGDGCSSICNIEPFWQCTSNSTSISSCSLSASSKPTITAQSISKIPKQNKISIILVLNIGLRLIKQNFRLQFGNLQQFAYTVAALDSKYTRFKLDIQYFKSVYKQKLSISVKSPIQTQSTTNRLLRQLMKANSRILQALQIPLTITLDLALDIQIQTKPPALYYSEQNRSNYTSVFYIIMIILHVAALLVFCFFTFYLRIKTMLYTIQFLNFITILYLYSTYGLFNVSQLAMQSARALQHFIYQFGQQLPDKYSGTNTSAGYFGFGAFILSGCVIQLFILGVCIIIKTSYGGSLSQISNTEKEIRQHRYNVFRYYHISFLYSFMPELILCCVIAFKWVEMNTSIQSSYSWGIAMVLLITILLGNIMYITYAHPYARIIQKSIRKLNVINPLPFTSTNVEVKGATQVIGDQKSQNRTNFVTVEQAIDQKRDMQQQKEEKNQNLLFDPFADEPNDNNNKDQWESAYQKSQKSEIKIRPKSRSKLESKIKGDVYESESNKTQAIIFDMDKKTENSQRSPHKKFLQKHRSIELISQTSQKSNSTSATKIAETQLVPLYDLTPVEVVNRQISDLQISYHRILLHQSYLPFKCCFISLMICIICQVQEPIPRCSLLIFSQLVVLIYVVISMRMKNVRTIKNIIMSLVLIGVAACGLAGALIIQLGKSLTWNNQTRDNMANTLYTLQAVEIGFIFFGILWNIVLYILQSVKSTQYKKYKVQKRNQEILQKNLRKNRLRNINPPTNNIHERAGKFSFGLKNIFSGMRGEEEAEDRIETKQHLRMDSENYTPAQFNNDNTNSNIILGMGPERKKNMLDIQDIENVDQNVEGNYDTKMHRKLKNALQINTNPYNTVPSVNVNKTDKNKKFLSDKQMIINSLEEIQVQERETNNLQSTRVNESGTYKGLKNRETRLGKQSRLQGPIRNNNLMAMLQNQLMGGDSNQTVIIVKDKKGNDRQNDTLISYKQSQQQEQKQKGKLKKKSTKQNILHLTNEQDIVEGSKKNQGVENIAEKHQNQQKIKKKSSYSIIKDLIPNREHEETPVISENTNKDKSNRHKEALERYLNQNIKDEQEVESEQNEQEDDEIDQNQDEEDKEENHYLQNGQHLGDGNQMDSQFSVKQGENEQMSKHYKYGIKGNKLVKQHSKQKNKLKKYTSNEQDGPKQKLDKNKKNNKIKKSYTSPYSIGLINVNRGQQEDYSLQEEIEPRKIKPNKYNDQVHMEKLQLPTGIRGADVTEEEIELRGRKGKGKKGQRLRRIDSISSIGEGIVEEAVNNRNKKRKFGESDQESDQSQGVTVFKKILQDYQIYKNKKVRGNPLRKN